MRTRIKWIDIAKGLMIIGMVLNHIPNLCNRLGVDISSWPWYMIFGHYGVFTMQSFFILSGYTTNFEQNVWGFLKKQVKGLLLPYLAFMLICSTVAYCLWKEPFVMDMYGEKYFFLVEGYWFLTALFIAKILMFFINKISRSIIIELGGGILLLLIGIAISELYSGMSEPSHWHNWFHYRNGLCMSVFIPIGYILKKYCVVEKYGLMIGFAFCVFYSATYLMTLFGIPYARYFAAPNYTHYLDPNLNMVNGFLLIPSYLFYCVTGSVLVFWISFKIKECNILESFGEKTLTIYCVHFTFLKLFINIFSHFINTESFWGASMFFFFIAILTLLTSFVIAKLFERKPLNYLLGKF